MITVPHIINVPEEWIIPLDRLDNPDYIEERVRQVTVERDRGLLRTALKYFYLTDGPLNLPIERFRAAKAYLEPREAMMIGYFFKRTNISKYRKIYGPNCLIAARLARYCCQDCGQPDVRTLVSDHVNGRDDNSEFRLLCASCHQIKSRESEDWSGKPRCASSGA